MSRLASLSFFAAMVLLTCAVATAQESKPQAPEKNRVVEIATLGAKTRAPTEAEVEKLGLSLEVRAKGQVLVEVADGGAASKSGLVAGDVLVTLDKVDVFSQDDIADVLRASSPGRQVEATVLRANSKKEEVLQIALGAEKTEVQETPRLAWQYAGLPHLEAALAKAKAEKKRVLVGLSGAET
jgi:S1-C subfamily serine protease